MWGIMEQVAVLKFTLGERYEDICIRDVQLWTSQPKQQDTGRVKTLKGRFVQYVDVEKLPLWATAGASRYACYTLRSSTQAYFASKLRHGSRGIVVELLPGAQLLVLHRQGDAAAAAVQCLQLDNEVKRRADAQIAARMPRGTSKEGSIDSIVQESQRQNHVKARAIRKSVQTSERKIQFNETLSKLILGGLRLRGVPNSQAGFHKLYKMTFDAAEFAHREELKRKDGDVPFETLQETVETLLKLFCKS